MTNLMSNPSETSVSTPGGEEKRENQAANPIQLEIRVSDLNPFLRPAIWSLPEFLAFTIDDIAARRCLLGLEGTWKSERHVKTLASGRRGIKIECYVGHYRNALLVA